MALDRGFQEVSVTRLGYQTAKQRVSIPPDSYDHGLPE
jgi:hypothetical protein